MQFYFYFEMARKYCPKELRGFEPALDYEAARIMQAWEYDPTLNGHAFILWAIRRAYDNIVERIGDEIAASNVQPVKNNVGVTDREAGSKADRGTVAPIS